MLTTRVRFVDSKGGPLPVSMGASVLTDLPSTMFRGFQLGFATDLTKIDDATVEQRHPEPPPIHALLPVSGPGVSGYLPWQANVAHRPADRGPLVVQLPILDGRSAGRRTIELDFGQQPSGHLLQVDVATVVGRDGKSLTIAEAERHWSMQAKTLDTLGSNAALAGRPDLARLASFAADPLADVLVTAGATILAYAAQPFTLGARPLPRRLVLDGLPEHVAWIRVVVVRDLAAWADALRRFGEFFSASDDEGDERDALAAEAEAVALVCERFRVPADDTASVSVDV